VKRVESVRERERKEEKPIMSQVDLGNTTPIGLGNTTPIGLTQYFFGSVTVTCNNNVNFTPNQN
jgi:hypothetical protein